MTTLSPNVDKGSGHAPLSELMSRGLMLFGDNNIDLADGSLAHLLLMFANTIITEINQHPYRTGLPAIEYYGHPEDVRAVNDLTMIYGLAGMYASHQASQKAPALMAQFYQTMNRMLWNELNGNTKIQARPTDAGSYSRINGQYVEEE